MSTVQAIRPKSASFSQKTRKAADEEDSKRVAPISDQAVENVDAEPAPPPPGMGKLMDRSI
jgi:hypothetical protein